MTLRMLPSSSKMLRNIYSRINEIQGISFRLLLDKRNWMSSRTPELHIYKKYREQLDVVSTHLFTRNLLTISLPNTSIPALKYPKTPT